MTAFVTRIGRGIRNAAAFTLIELAEFYRATISVVTPGSCRFYPTCSAYAVQAIKIHGPFRGTGLAILRILRCNPWGPFGEDPVPPRCCDQSDDDSSAHRHNQNLQNRIRTT